MAEGDRKPFTEKTQIILSPPANRDQLALNFAKIAGVGNKLGLDRREIVDFAYASSMTIPKKEIITLTWSPLEGADYTKRAELREAAAVRLLTRVKACDSVDKLLLLQVEIGMHLGEVQEIL
jgi:hypothetical protein